PVVGRQKRKRLLRALLVGDVPERLPVAERLAALLALRNGRLVGLERRERAGRAVCRVCDERRDLGDLISGEALLERRHSVAAVAHLTDDGRLIRLELVEVRPDLALCVRGLERVAAGAARGREHLRSRRARGALLRAAAGTRSKREDEDDPKTEKTQLHRPGTWIR